MIPPAASSSSSSDAPTESDAADIEAAEADAIDADAAETTGAETTGAETTGAETTGAEETDAADATLDEPRAEALADADADTLPADAPEADAPADPATPPDPRAEALADEAEADELPADAPDVETDDASADATDTEADEAEADDAEADDAEATTMPETELEAELEAVRDERDTINQRLLRTAAELQNYRKRTKREQARRYEMGKIDVVRALLDVLDDFQRSIDAAEVIEEKQDAEAAFDALKGGVEMVFTKFMDELGRLGVERIEAEGQPFDEAEHEALMQQPAPEGTEPGTVLREVRTGYRLGDRVIRYSRVVVAS